MPEKSSDMETLSALAIVAMFWRLDVSFAALDTANVCTVKATDGRELLLGEASSLAQGAYAAPELPRKVCCVRPHRISLIHAANKSTDDESHVSVGIA